MNWYKRAHVKTASVTFMIEGTHNIAKPMTVLDVCSDIEKYLFYVAKIHPSFGVGWQDIDPNPDDAWEPTGFIEFYLQNPHLKEGIIKGWVAGYNEHKAGAIVLRFVGISQSDRFKNMRQANLEVIENNTSTMEGIPQFNVANANAIALITMLQHAGLTSAQDPYHGILNVDDLQAALKNIADNDYMIQTFTQPAREWRDDNLENALNHLNDDDYMRQNHVQPTDEDDDENNGGMRMVNYGRTAEQIRHYLAMLQQMIDYINKNNLPNRQIVYGERL
jgi:hypothetical protein